MRETSGGWACKDGVKGLTEALFLLRYIILICALDTERTRALGRSETIRHLWIEGYRLYFLHG